jgi:hypothetical protein
LATIVGDPAASGDAPKITVSGTGDLTIASFSHNVSIGSLIETGSAAVVMNPSTLTNILIVPAGATFSIAPGARFDLGSNFLDFQNTNASQGASTLASVTGLLTTGYSAGNWTGNGGINSSVAAADSAHLKAIGVIINNNLYGTLGTLGTFDGVNPGQYDVLARLTYYGDANLNGKVDGSDYTNVDSGFLNQSIHGWQNGNFNYDTSIDGSDYTLIDNAFNKQGLQLVPTSLIASAASRVAAKAASPSAVPTSEIATSAQATDNLKKKKSIPWASTLIDSVFGVQKP